MENYGMVSIIIPVYNVENYLRECLQSICKQTYPYLEILVVDDESPDRSGVIADEFASVDHRIRVFHEKNRGAAGARNVALNRAKGDYIAFVDSDDWVENNYVERMLTLLQSHQVDIVQCQYMDETISGSKSHCYHGHDRIVDSGEYVKEMISHWEYVLLWNKLYRRDVIGQIQMPEGHCIDDEFFTYKVIMNANRIYLMEDELYHYRFRKSGAMGNRKKAVLRYRDQVAFITERYQPLASHYPNLKSLLLEHLAEVLLEVMRNSAWHKESYQNAKKALKHYTLNIMLDRSIPVGLKKSVVLYLMKGRRTIWKEISDSKADDQIDYYA